MNEVKIVISPKTIFLALGIILFFWVVVQARDVILFLFASYIIASALFPAVDWLSKRINRAGAVIIIFVVGFLALATIFVPFFSIMINQLNDFIAQLPKYYKNLELLIFKYQQHQTYSMFLPEGREIISKFVGFGENLVSKSIDLTLNIFTVIIAAFTLATVVLFILLDKEELKVGFLKFFPMTIRSRVELIIIAITRRVGGYVRGQIIVMIMVGIAIGIILSIIKIPFALLLGIVAGVLEMVPIIGPVIATIPAVLLAFTINPMLIPLVIMIYFLVQRTATTLSPFIYGKFLNMPPLVIIIAILIAASTLGVVGVILSPAIAAAIYVVIQELYLKKINNSDEHIQNQKLISTTY